MSFQLNEKTFKTTDEFIKEFKKLSLGEQSTIKTRLSQIFNDPKIAQIKKLKNFKVKFF